MSIKFENPPVVYSVAKIIFTGDIGKFNKEVYDEVLQALVSQGFVAFTQGTVNGIKVSQSDNQLSTTPVTAKRVGYFNRSRDACLLIDQRSIELRITKYTNHKDFLDTFVKCLDVCRDFGLSSGNPIKELELHYVDLFVPHGFELASMFNGIQMPNTLFHREVDDALNIGATNFVRVLKEGKTKVAVSLEQVVSNNGNPTKLLPDNLTEPDGALEMPIYSQRLFGYGGVTDYAIVHTHCAHLFGGREPNDFSDSVRNELENLYSESRKTFDVMIEETVCYKTWEKVDN